TPQGAEQHLRGGGTHSTKCTGLECARKRTRVQCGRGLRRCRHRVDPRVLSSPASPRLRCRGGQMSDADRFLAARDFLLAHRERYADAYANFKWPALERFNWALDYFDPMARGNDDVGLWVVRDDDTDHR